MSLLRSAVAGLRRLVRPDAFERDLDHEVAHFVEMTAAELEREGMPPDAARRAARLQVGGVERVKEDARAGGWEYTVDTVGRDIRYGVRSLRRNPGFTLAAIVTLAIGIGGNTTIFSLVNAILLRPPPQVRAPAELVSIYTSDFSGPLYGASSYPDFEAFREQRSVFRDVLLFAPRMVGVGEGDGLRREGMEVVSANYFQALGVVPEAGRFFLPNEGEKKAPVPVAVVGYELWQRLYDGRRSIVGETIRLNGVAFSVVGIAPRGFAGGQRGIVSGIWIPVAAASLVESNIDVDQRGDRSYFVMGRLAAGISLPQAQAVMNTVAGNLTAAHPEAWRDVSGKGRRISIASEFSSRVPPMVRGPVIGFMALLMGTVGLVLLVCCANVASLMLARANRRSREMGVRLALGATRGRVARQLLTESAILAVVGATLGVVLSLLATRAIMAFQPPLPLPVALDLGLDGRVLSFTALVALATGVIFGIAPAWQASRARVTGMLKGEGGASLSGRRVTLQQVLVVSQVAVSLLLLVAALFFVRSLRSAGRIDAGFATDHLLIVDAQPRPDLPGRVDMATLGLQIQERISAVPGVVSVTWGSETPLGLGASRRSVNVDGYRKGPGEDMEYHYNVVGPAFFETVKVPLVAGRGLLTSDRAGAPRVAVVSEAFASRFWPNENPLGRRLSMNGPEGPFAEVVGVARDARLTSLTDDTGPYLYLPALQESGATTFLVRTSVQPLSLREAMRTAVTLAAPGWLVTNVRTMESQVATSLTPQRIAGYMLSLFGLLALLLAAVGLYGVVAFSVAARTREIGVRVALGAKRSDIVRLIVRQGGVLVAVGTCLGLPAAWGAARLISSFLIGGEAASMLSYIGAATLLGVVTLVASWLPAQRGARVHPMVALRNE